MNRLKSFKPFRQKERGPLGGQLLRLIPLGGVGDVTKNMYVYEYGNDIIIVDCGIGFPDEGMLGIDLLIPDISYLRDKKSKIRAIVITHPHDDHIGGLPYIWPELQVPIYAPKLAAGFLRSKFTENKLPKDKINVLDIGATIRLGAFTVTSYAVSHSVPDATGLIIDTPVGRIIHQADFKLDWTPVSSHPTDVAKIAVAGEKGVLLMLMDALGVERAGYSISEREIQPSFAKIEKETQGKLLITTTSSNISRVQQAINVAAASGRKTALIGRSMESNFQVSRDLGYLDVPPGIVIAPDEIKRFPDNKLLLIIAGSQGQPESALSRVANNDHKQITLRKGDAVVFSADPIPGSEAAQGALIDKLTKMGMDVHYTGTGDTLHVSGHARREEIKVMINLVKPKYLMPIGVTFRQIKAFSKLASEMGWAEDHVLSIEDGKVITASPQAVRVDGSVEIKNIYVDGLGIGDISNVVLRDRKVLAEEGIVLVVVPLDAHTSRLAGDVDIISRGFIFEKEAEDLLERAKKLTREVLEDHPEGVLDWRFTRRHIGDTLEGLFYKETQRRPMILPIVVEV